ncbi:MAG: hypothetical protein A3G34_07210 [Candidatus Lindowbacteria bacterium RIFCSPLOWO2_12_FULL_62_27]|nr:MAG: hypothetical protein A3G34_07210 [Candidatus Lindowbacteria bacterium RIFCSPLOWO2_12_FULL_62_27]OGH61821.1 MAG: hypothetical protein A3I06_09400 [Candidatus Lindowbacteria bacterium RIFCSPLOWO2_02_FULL_62_12]
MGFFSSLFGLLAGGNPPDDEDIPKGQLYDGDIKQAFWKLSKEEYGGKSAYFQHMKQDMDHYDEDSREEDEEP